MIKKIVILLFLAVDVLIIIYIGIVIVNKLEVNSSEDKNKIEIKNVVPKQRNDEQDEGQVEQQIIEAEVDKDKAEEIKEQDKKPEKKVEEKVEKKIEHKVEKKQIVYRNIGFQYRDSRPKKVFLVGSFNNWKTGKDEFVKGENYMWRTMYKLAPGKYYYNYVVDNKWIRDPNNPNKDNKGPVKACSVLIVKPKESK